MRVLGLRSTGAALLSALFIALPVWAASSRDSPPPAARQVGRICHEAPFEQQPGWTISGSWSPAGELLVVDAFYNRVMRFSPQGDFLGNATGLQKAAKGNFTPSVLKEGQGSSLFLEMAQARMIRLDRNLTPGKTYDLKSESKRGGESLEGIFQWDLAGNEAVVFADIERKGSSAPEQWRSGFFRMPLDKPSAFRSLYEISPQDPTRLFYRLGNPLIASLGETSYILLMEERPRIYRSRKGGVPLEPLEAFPAGLEERPTLPSWKNLEDYTRLMRAVERSTMPVALFGWEGHLYIVGRHAEEGDEVRWTLTKIDPRADKVVWTTGVPLPPTARHVTVVPGPQQWAWIEKGVVRGLFNQDVDRILFLPAPKLRGVPGAAVCE